MIASKILIKNIYELQKQNLFPKILLYSIHYFSNLNTLSHFKNNSNINSNVLPNHISLFNSNKKILSKSYSIKSSLKSYYFTSDKTSRIKNKNKKLRKKKANRNEMNYYMNLLAFSGASSFMIYTLYIYNKKEINQTISSTVKFIKYHYSNIKNFVNLPYNSFVLLDKLELVNEPKEKTLVLNLNKTLVNYKYSLFDGFKIIQRPGLMHFINELSDYYEIVILANEDISLIDYISHLIDKNNTKIRYKLGTECIKYINGKPIKDLNYLNRDIDNTIIVDFDLNNISKSHKNNTIILPSFNGDGRDRELFFIIPFLKIISRKMNKVQDYIIKYGNFKTYENYYKQNQNNQNILIKP